MGCLSRSGGWRWGRAVEGTGDFRTWSKIGWFNGWNYRPVSFRTWSILGRLQAVNELEHSDNMKQKGGCWRRWSVDYLKGCERNSGGWRWGRSTVRLARRSKNVDLRSQYAYHLSFWKYSKSDLSPTFPDVPLTRSIPIIVERAWQVGSVQT